MVFLDEATKRVLYWPIIWSSFKPLTPMGREAKKELVPFLPGQEAAWEQSLMAQEQLWQAESTDADWGYRIETCLRKVPDLAGVLSSLERGDLLGVSDLFTLKRFVWQVQIWRKLLQDQKLAGWSQAKDTDWEHLLTQLNPTPPFTPSFTLSDAYDERLAELRKRLRELDEQLRQEREAIAMEIESEWGVRRNRAGEWVVEREGESARRFDADGRFERLRETPFDVVFTLRPTEKERKWTAEREQIYMKIQHVEKEVCIRLAAEIRPVLPLLKDSVADLARFDLQWARMRTAQRWKGCRPQWTAERIQIRSGFHPVVAEQLAERGQHFTPLDLDVSRGTTVIVGPNMGGKTIAMKTLGVICALAHFGFFVPAQSCSLPLMSFITGVIGDGQSTESGLSTFGAEVARISALLAQNINGLLLLDEIGRGTNPVEGAALSAAVTAYLSTKKHWSVHVTHYQEVLAIKGIDRFRTVGLVDVDESSDLPTDAVRLADDLQSRMDYRLVPFKGEESIPQQALAIASALGMPETIVTDARRRIEASNRSDPD